MTHRRPTLSDTFAYLPGWFAAKRRARRRRRVIDRLLIMEETYKTAKEYNVWEQDPELKALFDEVTADLMKEAVELGISHIALAVVGKGLDPISS